MLTSHHLNNSRSQRILWLAEELELDYDVVKHQRDPETFRSPASLVAVHALGKAPVIEHDGHVIAESGAIIEYMTRKLANGRLSVDPDSPEFGEYLQWLHFTEGTLQAPLIFAAIYRLTQSDSEALYGFYDAEVVRHQNYLEETFKARDYVVGSGFTAADINLVWILEFAEALGRMDSYPRLSDYLDRMRARPAYERALERGGPQDLSVFFAGISGEA